MTLHAYDSEVKREFVEEDNYVKQIESAFPLSKADRASPIQTVYNCPVCSKQLISQRALVQHSRRIHKNDKQFVCNIYGCTFQCARRTDLDRHKQLHVEERNVICEHCGKTFTSISILNDHVLYVHNKERQFICEQCGKTFKRNSLLKRHKLSHGELRPFPCGMCKSAFKRSHHLTRHMETCHKIILEKKKKVVKLMKTEDGLLIPIPESPKAAKEMKTLKTKITQTEQDINVIERDADLVRSTDVTADQINFEYPLETYSNNSSETIETLSKLGSLLESSESTPQVLSLLNVYSRQVITVEVNRPNSNSVDNFETNCTDMSRFPNYGDLELQSEILNTHDNYCDSNYFALSLENVEGTTLFFDSNDSKIDILPPIENYLA